MTEAPDDLTETPRRVLEDVLGRISLRGSIFLRGEYGAPWAYTSPPSSALVEMLKPGAARLVLFHVVPEGRCFVALPSGERVEAEAGDALVLPYADQHSMGSLEADGVAPPVSIGELLPPPPWRAFPVIRHGGDGRRTQVVCGYLACDELLFNPFLRALPPLLRVRPPAGPATDWIAASVRYALAGGSGAGVERLYQLIFVEVLAHYIGSVTPEQVGWLAALRDPILGRAILELHRAPAEPWTVALLAARVATSRSVLDERFRRLLGRSPMRYLTEWRVQLASELLRASTLGVAEIASRTGYESEASFSRAFRRLLGQPPARWRDRRAAGAQ
jgi:AraC-like DNA-binding protein